MKNLPLLLLLLLPFQMFAQSSDQNPADSLLNAGIELFKQKKHEQSDTVLLAARSLALKNPGRESATYASCLHYLGSNNISLGRFEKALPLLLEALDIRRKVVGPNHPDCAKTLNNLAILCNGLKRLAEAEQYAIEALRIKENDPGIKSIDYSNSQNTLAQILQSKGQYEKEDSVVLDLMRRRKEVLNGEMNVPYANALNLRGGLLTLQYRFEEAEENFLKALDIMKSTAGENSHPYLTVSINLGQLYAKMGQYQKAETAQRACIQLAAALQGKTSPEYALAVYNLGFVLQQQGLFEESLPVLEDALGVSQNIYGHESKGSVQIVGNLASTYYYMGDFKKSAELQKKAVDELEQSELRNEDYYLALLNYGTVLYNLNELETAETYLLKAEKDYPQLPVQRSSGLNLNLGLLYLAWGKTEMAEQRFLKAVSALERKRTVFSSDDVSIYFRLVQVYQFKNNYEKALFYAQQGQKFLEKNLLQSVNYLSDAEIREVAALFFSRNSGVFEAALNWNKPELNGVCYDNLLFAKGFVLENALKLRRNFEKPDQMNQPDLLAWKILRRQIAEEFSKSQIDLPLVDSLEIKANALEKTLAGTSALKALPHWQDVQNALGEKESAIEFVRCVSDTQDPYYMALVLTKKAPPQAIRLCEEQALAGLFRAEAFPLATFYGKGADPLLYQLIFKPLMPFIGQSKSVLYAPAGLLHRVNFQAMSISGDHILADLLDLTLLGSTRQITERDPAGTNTPLPSNALLLGGIRYQSMQTTTPAPSGTRGHPVAPPWEYLPGSLVEVNSIKRVVNAADIPADLFSDSMATEQLLRQHCTGPTAPGILHIASHAFYSPDTVADRAILSHHSPMHGSFAIWAQDPLLRVKIVMAGADNAANPGRKTPDDGYINAYEISLLDLKDNQLAVVSACDSGLGDLDPNEGVWGLSRAFRIAGTRNVILSLWKASDAGAVDFMTTFYLNWLGKKTTIHKAFKSAQESMRAFNADPKYWAGFMLSE